MRLPRVWWPPEWFDQNGVPKFHDPVVLLVKALYGHPESGALWDRHLAKHLTDLGWERLPDCPGSWRHSESGAILVVYVDGLLMISPVALEAALWGALEKRIGFKEPATPIGRYLGANHKMTKSGDESSLIVSMVDFVKTNACEEYRVELGLSALPPVHAPFQGELAAEQGEPAGKLAHSCASHLMRLLFAARMARPDLLVAITRLASHVSKWKAVHDKALHQLMCYAATHSDEVLTGSLSTDDLLTAQLVASPDADLAGDKGTTKSTSGLWLELRSLDGRRSWPLTWHSRKQGSTASHT